MFRILSSFAKQFLLIAGSSTTVERLWSLTRDAMDPKRSCMADKTVAALILLKGMLKDEDNKENEESKSETSAMKRKSEATANTKNKKRRIIKK